jgi:hypothetical protein
VSDQRRRQYAQAFYDQASSDWQVYRLLADASLPQCHPLHYLQMACEKLGKAHRLSTLDANVDTIATRHVGFAQFVNTFLRSPPVIARYAGKTAAHKSVCQTAAAIAREIEKLAPAIDRAQFPENAEYPWEKGDWEQGTGEVLVPCKYPYPSLSLLKTHGGRAFLKLVEQAFRDWNLA